MQFRLIVYAALLICSCGQAIYGASKDDRWIEVQASSPEYGELAGQDLVLIAKVSITGARPAGTPDEETQWFACIQVGNHPWVQVDNLSDYQTSFHSLRGERTLQELNQVAVLIKCKLKHERAEGQSPVLIVGWMRELLASDPDWSMPWQINFSLLPLVNDKIAISHIVACQATSDADSQLGYSGVHHANQTFRILESFYGEKITNKNVVVHYSYVTEHGRDLKKDERVIWILTNRNNHNLSGYGAIPDTPNNRLIALELTKRLRQRYQGKAQQKHATDKK